MPSHLLAARGDQSGQVGGVDRGQHRGLPADEPGHRPTSRIGGQCDKVRPGDPALAQQRAYPDPGGVGVGAAPERPDPDQRGTSSSGARYQRMLAIGTVPKKAITAATQMAW